MSGINREARRRNSQKSGFRQLYGHQDRGQRYEVRYRDGMGTWRAYGFTESHDLAAQWVSNIRRHLVWHSPRIVDRQENRRAG